MDGRAESDPATLADPDGVAELFDRHARAVFRAAMALVRNADDAQDVMQETFIVAWRKRRSIRLIDASALPWLLATARNVALDHQRAARRRRTDTLAPEDLPEPTPAGDAADAFDAVRDAVAALTPVDQLLVRLVLVEQLPYADAAARLGLTSPAARKRLQRARDKLRRHLARPTPTSEPNGTAP